MLMSPENDCCLMKKLLRRSFCFGIILSLALTSASAATFTNPVSGLAYTFKNLTVTNGDTVVWTGLSTIHSVTPNTGVTEPFCGNTFPGTCTVTFNVLGSFGYHCINHGTTFNMTGVVTVVSAPAPSVTVSITNPVGNALFAAPALVPVGVMANSSTGAIVNVQLLTNGIVAASNGCCPTSLSFTLTNLAAGNYGLQARATDDIGKPGSTSAPVNIRVVTRPALIFSPGTNGPLQFSFNTVTGVNYVVEGGTAVTNVSATSLTTNPGSGGPLTFTQTNPASAQRFFRVRLQ